MPTCGSRGMVDGSSLSIVGDRRQNNEPGGGLFFRTGKVSSGSIGLTPRACVRDATGGPKSRAWTASGTPGRQFTFFLVIQKNEISTASGHRQGKRSILINAG